jgi:hypothetical protein
MKIHTENFDLNHDKLCRCMIGIFEGKSVQVFFGKGGHVSGKVVKKGKKIFIGKNRLNGELISAVFPQILK